jgi:hypothetical protein
MYEVTSPLTLATLKCRLCENERWEQYQMNCCAIYYVMHFHNPSISHANGMKTSTYKMCTI